MTVLTVASGARKAAAVVVGVAVEEVDAVVLVAGADGLEVELLLLPHAAMPIDAIARARTQVLGIGVSPV